MHTHPHRLSGPRVVAGISWASELAGMGCTGSGGDSSAGAPGRAGLGQARRVCSLTGRGSPNKQGQRGVGGGGMKLRRGLCHLLHGHGLRAPPHPTPQPAGLAPAHWLCPKGTDFCMCPAFLPFCLLSAGSCWAIGKLGTHIGLGVPQVPTQSLLCRAGCRKVRPRSLDTS